MAWPKNAGSGVVTRYGLQTEIGADADSADACAARPVQRLGSVVTDTQAQHRIGEGELPAGIEPYGACRLAAARLFHVAQ